MCLVFWKFERTSSLYVKQMRKYIHIYIHIHSVCLEWKHNNVNKDNNKKNRAFWVKLADYGVCNNIRLVRMPKSLKLQTKGKKNGFLPGFNDT